MAARNVEEHPTVAWKDVEDAIRRIQNDHCCDVRVEMTVPVSSGTPVLLWVGIWAQPRIVGRLTIRAPIKKQHRWPTPHHKTIAGLVFNLLWDLDRTLDQLGHCPAEQASFAWAE